MTLYKDKFKVDSIRLKNWDYSSEAVYFITIVTKNRECIFGNIEDDKMILNENGKIIETELLRSITIRESWFFHNWVIMPNHIHLLIEIQSTNNIQNQYEIENDNKIKTTSKIQTTTHIVEAHGSASPHSISEIDDSLATTVAETHYRAPLQNQSESELLEKQILKFNKNSTTHIVEAHGSVSAHSISKIDDSLTTTVAETHCCAPLQNQSESELLEKQILKFSKNNTTHIVEAHGSASLSSISTTEFNTSLSTTVAETHSSAPLQNQSMSKFVNKSNLSRKPKSISSFVAIFKSITTKQINGFETIWQDNYHDHIVRNYKRFEIIYDYIKNNPKSWETDSLK
ncbi:hypothetical protein BD847_0985 [Flavobacterium cutihirudinis]|uniref:Transposase IS200-like domain-containing protein n=1 Tax=Flavobacterium cutihirudinis TaxID=1265740 RepID=A0A3D9G1L1_9FLAO|nr:transposase [Flavobacterium cutihirudinis]RED27053.1 hypothetical protein BD847_0985 [Flavobacterium cutihirudinis]